MHASSSPVALATVLLALTLPPLQAQERDTRLGSAASRAGVARGPLPDPSIFDGTNQEAEKRPEHGMLGEFEMGGNTESKSDRVGGMQEQTPGQKSSNQQQPSGGQNAQNQQQGGGGSQADSKQNQQNQGGGGSQGDPSQQGGGGGQQQGGQQGGGGQNGQIPTPNGGGAQGTAGASGSQAGAAGTSSTGGAAGAQADGIQSSGLSGPSDGSAASQSSAAPSKPGEMKIGDAALQIKTLPSGTASQVVGVQQPAAGGKDAPQAYDAKTPGGGKQGGSGRGNSGVERGKVMPAGL